MRLAIVGLGPKGLYALERLIHHVTRFEPVEPIVVDLYEPYPVPGAGPVYDPAQPLYLRMNFQADQVNVWQQHNAAVPPERQLNFESWAALDGFTPDVFPPRADVGRYLSDCFQRLLSNRPQGIEVRHIRSHVVAVRRTESRWLLTAEIGAASYDEVLLATGHAKSWQQGLAADWEHDAPLVPHVFPVDRWLSRDQLPPGAVVAARGFALTFIDAALAVTEGRGGTFDSAGPDQLTYTPSAEDVATIIPFSRTGRPMLVKPEPDAVTLTPEAEFAAAAGRDAIKAIEEQRPLASLIDTIEAVAASVTAEQQPLGRHLSDMTAGKPPATALTPHRELMQSLRIASGLQAPDSTWALGHAWRSLYPAIVQRFGGDGLHARDWPTFRHLAEQMERLAFGPPPINARKILALADCGRVDLAFTTSTLVTTPCTNHTELVRGARRRRVDRVVDTVLPGPGAVSPLGQQLVRDGYAHTSTGRRGVAVSADGALLDRRGERVPGLSAIGRLTEDSTIGNDTLSRHLHPTAELWAARIAESASTKEPQLT